MEASQRVRCNDYKLWVYNGISDDFAAINSADFFNDAANILIVRDLMIVCDTVTPTTSFVTVLSNTESVVDVPDSIAVAETNRDWWRGGDLSVTPVPYSYWSIIQPAGV